MGWTDPGILPIGNGVVGLWVTVPGVPKKGSLETGRWERGGISLVWRKRAVQLALCLSDGELGTTPIHP